jgi:hypothetical protein
MSDPPRVSVIIIFRDAECFLDEAVASVLPRPTRIGSSCSPTMGQATVARGSSFAAQMSTPGGRATDACARWVMEAKWNPCCDVERTAPPRVHASLRGEAG